jgi:predicted 2-oxoglutarate/Fe(II)-dependent dioxygenase YbiX
MESLLDYVKVYKNVIPHELCDGVIAKYKDSKNFKLSPTEGGYNSEIRSCTQVVLTEDEEFDTKVFYEQKKNIKRYLTEFPQAAIDRDTGYALLKYEVGTYFKEHVDHSPRNTRTISCSMILNDDFEGGDFAFFDKEHIIKANKGDVIMFPSNFLYRHQVLPVTKGTRYSIITWFK